MKMRKTYFTGLLLSAVLLTVQVFAQGVNSKAPDFSVKDLDGNEIKLADLKGKTILLDFWASWCVPCKKSMPHLIDLYNDHKADSLIVIGINVDEEKGKIKEFQSGINQEIPFPIVFDKDSKLPALYDVEGMPTTIVISKDGIIKYKEVGYNSDLKEKLDKTITDLLAK